MAELFWLGAIILFLIVEANTVALASLWFSAGALVALIAAVCGGELWLQIVLFLGVSAVLLACLRPLVRRVIRPKLIRTNADALIGSEGYVTQTIDNRSAVGRVKLGSMEWSARSADGEIIEAGTLVQTERIEGVKAIVTPVEAKAEI